MFTISVPKRDSLRDNVEKFATNLEQKKKERSKANEKKEGEEEKENNKKKESNKKASDINHQINKLF